MSVLFDGEIHVHYGFIVLSTADDEPALIETRRGQRNGLCGAAVPGVLSMVTGTHTGAVRLRVEWSAAEPSLDVHWEDIVEAPFIPLSAEATLSAFEESHPLLLGTADNLRARFCANGMDNARDRDGVPGGLPPATERYLLQLWPAEPGPDAVLRQTSRFAGYRHAEAAALPPPPDLAQRVAAARAAAERARLAAERRELALWAGHRPSPRLRALGGNAISVARFDWDLLEAFVALDAGTQREAARWLARRALAAPTISSAMDPDPLRALVDTFSHAVATADDRRAGLVSDLRRWLAAR